MSCEASEVILFMSADVVGSTAFKGEHSDDAGVWLGAFATLFRELPLVFMGELGMAFLDSDTVPEAGVWKVMGDEVIFVTVPRSSEEAALATQAFVRTVREYDRRLAERWPLRIRGACWAAELGARNRQIDIPEMFGGTDGQPYRDFLGPDIDTGFRLSAHSGHGEVILSPNLAECIARQQQGAPAIRFHHFADKPLKGVIAGQPFPLIIASDIESPGSKRAVTPDGELLTHLQALRTTLQRDHGAVLAPCLFEPA
ncbi:MAG: hypothetical protein KDJ14_09000 [Xanthomonadales bacterium]|nr:hypothetical protein [Xanthomonadales bacterium]